MLQFYQLSLLGNKQFVSRMDKIIYVHVPYSYHTAGFICEVLNFVNFASQHFTKFNSVVIINCSYMALLEIQMAERHVSYNIWTSTYTATANGSWWLWRSIAYFFVTALIEIISTYVATPKIRETSCDEGCTYLSNKKFFSNSAYPYIFINMISSDY